MDLDLDLNNLQKRGYNIYDFFFKSEHSMLITYKSNYVGKFFKIIKVFLLKKNISENLC